MRALYIAATGMTAQEATVNTVANNIANMRTTGFKRQRVDFQDLFYQTLRRAGAETSADGTMVPSGVQVGSGVRVVATPRIMSQGDIELTSREHDMAIRGEGYFQVELPDGRTAYTRDGSFQPDAEGQLVTQDGFVVAPGIVIPDNARDLTVNPLGQVQAVIGTDTAAVVLGQVQLARFANKGGLEAMGDNLFLETGASGAAQVGNPGDEGFGTILQNHLEGSNVVAVSELTELISAQRAYEMNSRIIRGADEMLQATAQLR